MNIICNQIKHIVKFGIAKQIMDILQYLYKYTYDCDGVPLLHLWNTWSKF
jgi:hypothetical protein